MVVQRSFTSLLILVFGRITRQLDQVGPFQGSEILWAGMAVMVGWDFAV